MSLAMVCCGFLFVADIGSLLSSRAACRCWFLLSHNKRTWDVQCAKNRISPKGIDVLQATEEIGTRVPAQESPRARSSFQHRGELESWMSHESTISITHHRKSFRSTFSIRKTTMMACLYSRQEIPTVVPEY